MILLGRRGPAQAAFTNPELRELGELARADVVGDPAQVDGRHRARDADRSKRNVELFRDYAQREPPGKSHRIELRFLRSPVEILGEGEDGPVTGVRVVGQPARGRRARVPDRRGGGHRVRARAALDRLPRPPARRHPVRRAPRA